MTNRRNDEYWKMVEQWRIVVSRPLPDDEKRRACLAILRDHIDRMAVSHARRPNPTLRFWADMVLLQERISPGPGSGDELGRLALMPAAWLVRDWLTANRHGVSALRGRRAAS